MVKALPTTTSGVEKGRKKNKNIKKRHILEMPVRQPSRNMNFPPPNSFAFNPLLLYKGNGVLYAFRSVQLWTAYMMPCAYG